MLQEVILTLSNMYEGAVTSTRITYGERGDLLVAIGLHQGSPLRPYLFSLIIDELNKKEIPWCMPLANEIVVNESKDSVNVKLCR